jgi:crossover junction endodeoxyribonuclease RuvC
MPKTKILAIDPGTRAMGIALLEGEKLVYHAVLTIRKGKTPHETLAEARRLILRLIADFKPNMLAIEKTFFANNRNSAILNVLADEIKAIGKRKGLEVVCYAPSTVKKFITGDGRASKLEVAKVVIAQYPELKVYLNQDRKWKEAYHLNMFDAVALGIMAHEMAE